MTTNQCCQSIGNSASRHAQHPLIRVAAFVNLAERGKCTVLLSLLPFLLFGCSRREPASKEEISTASSSQAFTIVESQDTHARGQIKAQANELFTNRAFSDLDALAAKYRVSKEAYADGSWKLVYIYEGLDPGDDAADDAWKSRIAGADEWSRKRPDSITARVAKARLLIGYAWSIRGGGTSDTVTEKQWNQFADLLQQAGQVLQKAKPLSERCPLYWSTWQRVALGLEMKIADYDSLFQQAIKEFPDYVFYYNSRATFLLPRWFGEPGDWEKDLTSSADLVGGEAGDILYAQVVCHIHNYGGGIDVFEGNRISWQRVEKGLEGLLKKFPDSVV
jgi:hypothetical protein